MNRVFFQVFGQPVPQGSVKAFIPKGWTRPVLTSTGGKKLKSWRQDVSTVALAARPAGWELEGVFSVTVTFYFVRPKSAKKRDYPNVLPDLDKLLRALGDSLTGILVDDDSRIVHWEGWKKYGVQPAMMVEVLRL
jgi:crossover junction endodeoxyribonuclease RusA